MADAAERRGLVAGTDPDPHAGSERQRARDALGDDREAVVETRDALFAR
jgi:hypothetical protein